MASLHDDEIQTRHLADAKSRRELDDMDQDDQDTDSDDTGGDTGDDSDSDADDA